MNKKLKFIELVIIFMSLLFNSACLDSSHSDSHKTEGGTGMLVINEIAARTAGGDYDWIELYVAGDKAVYLGDYSIVDGNENHEPIVLPGFTLSPGSFIIIKATDEETEGGSYYLPFKLGSDDRVILYLGSDIVDVLDWEEGDASSGKSYGRLPDGTGVAKILTPTPGQINMACVQNELFAADKVVEVRLEMSDAAWQAILANPMAEEYQSGSITYNGIRIDQVAIRVKGNSSLMTVARDPDSNRYSFKIDMNYYVSGQDLLGLQKLNLNNGFSDPTFMREYLSYNLMRSLGLATPACAFVNLYVNDELFGLYLAVEQVDDEFIKAHFDQDDGDLYKAGMGSDLLWKGNSIEDYPTLTLELKTNEDTSDHSALLTMLDVLNNGTDYASVINVDSVLGYLAVSTALTNLDSYQGAMAQNYYLYEENGVFTIIPWDFNMSFGGFNMGSPRETIIGFMIDEPTSGKLSDRPLIAKLLQDPGNLETYHGYLNQLINGPFDPNTMAQAIDEAAYLIREYVYADPTKFYSTGDFEQALNEDISSDPNAIVIAGFDKGFTSSIGLKAFVRDRVASIRDQLAGLSPAIGDGSGNGSGGFFPGGGPGGGGEQPSAIIDVSPSSAGQGDMNLMVTITLDQQMMMFSSKINPQSVKIGTLEGRNISLSGLEITAVFDIPLDEPVGKKDVSVTFPQPEFPPQGEVPPSGEVPPGGGLPPAGGFPPQGELPPPREFPPAGGFSPPGGFPMPGDQCLIFIKAGAFEILSGE